MITAATRQLRREGARSVTLETVAREAQCAKGLVTYHFKSRDQLLSSAAAELLGARTDDWRAAISATDIDSAIEQSFRLLRSEAESGFWTAWMSLFAEGSKLTVRTVNNHWLNYVEAVELSAADLLKSAGLETVVRPEEAGRMLAGGLQGLGLQLATGSPPQSLEGAHAALWAGFLGLTRPAAPRNRPG